MITQTYIKRNETFTYHKTAMVIVQVPLPLAIIQKGLYGRIEVKLYIFHSLASERGKFSSLCFDSKVIPYCKGT
jgi:hypothetical protein